jgi:hypothetical protein
MSGHEHTAGDYVTREFHFRSGEMLLELRLHCRTLGPSVPVRPTLPINSPSKRVSVFSRIGTTETESGCRVEDDTVHGPRGLYQFDLIVLRTQRSIVADGILSSTRNTGLISAPASIVPPTRIRGAVMAV